MNTFDIPQTPEEVADAIRDDWASPLVFDLMESKMGWSKANRIWAAGCNLFDRQNGVVFVDGS